ncbi:MAG: hypothetical protein NTV01_04855 [Bacteroidia bacterium]|nr:hypothetical protein [Bacteroidia bacterium]
MEIDNDKNASKAKAILITAPFISLLASSLLALFLVIYTWIPTIISGILMLMGWSITVVLKLKSVRFRFSNDTITVLYYPLSPMTSNFKRIDISFDKLLKFEVKTILFGLRKELILHESINGEDASYPPVSISLFGKETTRKLEEYLNDLCPHGTSSKG